MSVKESTCIGKSNTWLPFPLKGWTRISKGTLHFTTPASVTSKSSVRGDCWYIHGAPAMGIGTLSPAFRYRSPDQNRTNVCAGCLACLTNMGEQWSYGRALGCGPLIHPRPIWLVYSLIGWRCHFTAPCNCLLSGLMTPICADQVVGAL